MKKLTALLALGASLLLVGCVGFTPAHVVHPRPRKEIVNNLQTNLVVEISDNYGFTARIKSGESAYYVFSGGYYGNSICFTAKVFDEKGEYKGIATLSASPWDCYPWIIGWYQPQTRHY